MITKYRPLGEINEAFDDMVSGAATRTVLTFQLEARATNSACAWRRTLGGETHGTTRGAKTMKASSLLRSAQPIPVEEVDLDGPQKGEVRVKMAGAGACHSDYHAVTGHSVPNEVPFVMGHEGAGVVEEVGEGVEEFAPGDHVIFSLTRQCGTCRNCTAGPREPLRGRPRRATDRGYRFSKDGVPVSHRLATFSEETVVSASSLVKTRKDIPIDKLCLFGCSVMTGVGAVVNRAKVETGSTVAIFGCGGVGLHAVQGAKLASASKIIAVDMMDTRLDIAKEFGATHTINADREDPVGRIMDMTGGGVDYAFEVVGTAGGGDPGLRLHASGRYGGAWSACRRRTPRSPFRRTRCSWTAP